MKSERIDFVIENAGCLIYLAPRTLGGLSADEFYQVFSSEGEESLHQLVKRGAIMPMTLYQDDGYLVRVVMGDLTEQEESEWVARAVSKLDLSCGEMIVSGSLDPDLERELAKELKRAKHKGSYWFGCSIKVPPGKYHAEVYSFAPGDLAGAWGQIEDPELFSMSGDSDVLEAEPPADYFRRTRPGQKPPRWITDGDFEEKEYVNFLVRLSPLMSKPPALKFEEDGCLQWKFRKPDKCPLGIRSAFSKKS